MNEDFSIEIWRLSRLEWYWKVRYGFFYGNGVAMTENGAKRAANKAAQDWRQSNIYRSNSITYTYRNGGEQ